MIDIEYRTPAEIKLFQEDLLRRQLKFVAENSKYYSKLFAERGIDVSEIRTIEDLVKLPFTEKTDFQLHQEEFRCVPKDDVIDYVTTSGTTGEPIVYGYSEHDLQRLALNEYKSFACAGVGKSNMVQLMVTLDKRFIAGMAYFLGLRKLGAGLVRVGNGIPELQWDTIKRLEPDTIVCVPSFILKLIEYAEDHGIDYHKSSIRRIVGIGEGLRAQDFSLNLLGKRIQEKWPEVQLFATYAGTELGTTFPECEYGVGGHLHPELAVVEIIGEDGLPVKDGEYGEIVVTNLGIEAFPLVRYRVGDIAAKRTEQCKCGRWSYRLTPILGRKNNMIKLKGTTLYPPAINDVLDNTSFVENYITIVRTNDAGTDAVEVNVGLKSNERTEEEYIKELKDRFRSRIRVAPDITIRPVEEIQQMNCPEGSRKVIKFIDKR